MTKIKSFFFMAIIAIAISFVQNGQAFGQGHFNYETKLGEFELAALEEKPDGSLDPSKKKMVRFGIWTLAWWIPREGFVTARQHRVVTQGICNALENTAERLACEQTLWNLGQQIELPSEYYAVEIRQLPGQGNLKLGKIFSNYQFINGLPNTVAGYGRSARDIGQYWPYITHRMYFGCRENGSTGYMHNGRGYWATGQLTWEINESFGVAHGSDPSPIQIWPGVVIDLLPNHNGDQASPYGFQLFHSWVKTINYGFWGNKPLAIQVALSPNSATTLLNLGVVSYYPHA